MLSPTATMGRGNLQDATLGSPGERETARGRNGGDRSVNVVGQAGLSAGRGIGATVVRGFKR